MDASGEFPGLGSFEWGESAARVVCETMASDGAHDAAHLGRVFESARKIGRGEAASGREFDWEVVVAAVLFHDVVNLSKDSEERDEASARSARRAVEFFDRRPGFDEGRLELLSEAVERHSFSRGLEPQSLEAAILRDADRLDTLGAVGLARVFYVSGTMEGAIHHPLDPFAEKRERDDTAYAIDHFFEKLLHLRDDFLTPTARRMAEERHDYLVEFLDRFADEVGERRSPHSAGRPPGERDE